MTPFRKEKVEKIIRGLAAEFIKEESGPQSLVTVIEVSFDERKNKALIFISVLPEDKEKFVLDFINRKKRGFIEYMKKNSRFKFIPFIEFSLVR